MKKKTQREQTPGEEIANSITHGIGAALSIAALVILVVFASLYGDAWRVVSFSIYGTTLFVLYLASTLYHSFRNKRVKHFFNILDHSSIFLLIAGTYTPITLISMRGPWGWTLFGLIWGMAIIGILSKIFFIDRFKLLSVGLYIAMGWLILIAVRPMLEMVPAGQIKWLVIGGLCYTFGVIFYVIKRVPYFHFIWHLFVLAGSISHFIGIFLYLTGK
ncbi:hemolysin III family protein [bacterium]|nr:hemolysin III family protein [bacterium]